MDKISSFQLRGCSRFYSKNPLPPDDDGERAMLGQLKQDDCDSSSIASLLKPIVVPEDQVPIIQMRQLETVGRLTPIIALANLINAAVVVMSFWNTPAHRLLGFWSFTLILATIIMVAGQVRARTKKRKASAHTTSAALAQERIERYARFASFLGLLWGMLPLLIMPFTDPTSQLAVSVIIAGMMFGGVILISRIPEAAIAFMVPMTIGYIVGLQLGQDPRNDFLSVLALIYAGVLWVSVKWSHRQFVEQHMSGVAVKQQAQLIGLLLRDFEESTSDWLWQTDTNATLVEIPMPILSENTSFEMMARGVKIDSLFIDTEARSILAKSLERRQSFRDLILQVMGDDGAWWSLTGKPIYDSAGEYLGFRGVASDITQSKAIEDRIAYMAHYDPLTSLPNRACLHEHLEKAALRPIETGCERALLWLDLDNFKWVNDTLGHPAGDELLCRVATRLNETATGADVVARLGGDEFAVLLEAQGHEQLMAIVQLLSDELNRPYDIWGSIVHCGASIGVRIIEQHNADTQTLLMTQPRNFRP